MWFLLCAFTFNLVQSSVYVITEETWFCLILDVPVCTNVNLADGEGAEDTVVPMTKNKLTCIRLNLISRLQLPGSGNTVLVVMLAQAMGKTPVPVLKGFKIYNFFVVYFVDSLKDFKI